MTLTISNLIKKRKELWDENKNIEIDNEYREAVAQELITNSKLLEELQEHPESLIELMFIVVDKEQNTMPFFLNEVQQTFIKILNKAIDDYNHNVITDISILVLKGRQQGFTTLITAIQLSYDLLTHNFQGLTLSDKADNTETIFQNKAKFPYNALPDIIKPTEKLNNRKQLLFSKLNSSWSVDTATEQVGRSKTINFFHGSECAFWKCGISPIQAGLGEAFTKNCIKIYESTANGYNDYEKMWSSGNHINCFFEWWLTKEYRTKFENEEIHKEFLHKIETKKEWIFERLRWLKNEIKLEDEQLYWYYKKYQKYIDKDLIKQEYPCTPKEAFLLSGKNVFDTEVIIKRIAELELKIKLGYKTPLKIGKFIYDYDGNKISNIRWLNTRDGFIKIYQLPNTPEVTKYCVGGDTAGEGSDYFIGQVLNAKTGKQVATLRKQFDADEYTRQMYCLGKYYKNAMLAIESNFDSFPIRELQRLKYKNMYVSEKIDTYTKKVEQRYGFRTTSITRPTILSKLIEVVRTNCELIDDLDTLNELLTIIRNEKGRIEAPEGGHDDLMMALAIAWECRNQVIFRKKVINQYPEFNFKNEKGPNYDWGEKDYIV